MSAPVTIRVIVADDHPVVLAGIRALLDGHPDIEIVGEARDGRTALRMAIELQPSVVVVDLSMPGLNGVEVTKLLLAERPQCKVVVLTVPICESLSKLGRPAMCSKDRWRRTCFAPSKR